MLRHAAKFTSEPVPARIARRPHHASLYTVLAYPGDVYPRGNRFPRREVLEGLLADNWPEGMVFVSPEGMRVVVRGGALVEVADV